MSWDSINIVICLAALDDNFCQELLKDPLPAIQSKKFELTQEEKNLLKDIRARDLSEFSSIVIKKFRYSG